MIYYFHCYAKTLAGELNPDLKANLNRHRSICFFSFSCMNINLQLKIKETKEDIHQAYKHLRIPGTNLINIKYYNI